MQSFASSPVKMPLATIGTFSIPELLGVFPVLPKTVFENSISARPGGWHIAAPTR